MCPMEVLKEVSIDRLLDLPRLIPSHFSMKFAESIGILEKLYEKNKKWIVTYSGGKDSTALVVLALYMKERFPDIDLSITYSDTQMEIPGMALVARNFLDALQNKYDSKVRIVTPDIEDTYWVRMIGRGYPPPGPRFRWCTPKIKIKPSRKLHNDEGLFITGLRLGESQQRDVRLKNSCLNSGANECGGDVWATQKGIDVAAPIIHWDTFDVWQFLMITAVKVVPEAQLVVDLYGNTSMRFGCWMCTVVMKDKTMIALANAGDPVITKLLAFREWIQEEKLKPENRYIRKDGRKGRLSKSFRRELLEKLLSLQEEVKMQLITDSEVKRSMELLKSKKYGEY